MYDTEPHPTHVPAPAHAPRKLNAWLSGLAAVAVVALIAGVFFALPHNGKQPHIGPGGSPATSTGAACAPGAIKASLPNNAYLYDLSMVSPTDGWAVGAIMDATNGPSASLILRFNHCRWTQVGTAYPNISLGSISMVSATSGWITGSLAGGGENVLLKYSGGTWQRIHAPAIDALQGNLGEVRMLSATEGWIVVGSSRDAHGAIASSLLHYTNGTWTSVTPPISWIDDIAVVGPNDAWISGRASDFGTTGALAHYHNGQWTKVMVPGGTEMTRLTAVSATDIWATGETPLNGNYYEGVEKAAVLHYDGSAWKQVNVGASPRAQRIVVLGDHDIWAFGVTHAANDPSIGNLTISLAQHQTGDRWQSVNLPITDLQQILALTPVGPDEYWAIGQYEVYGPNPNDTARNTAEGIGHRVLLHYANGTWTQYGR